MRPATTEDLALAISHNFPDVLLDFYRSHEPDPKNECIELEQRIWAIRFALRENLEGLPGVGLFPHGFVVFASTQCGDSYCVDTNTRNDTGDHPITLFSHETVDEDAPLEEIMRCRVEVAPSFQAFLELFLSGDLSEEPNYG